MLMLRVLLRTKKLKEEKNASTLKNILKIATPEKIIFDRYPELNPNEPYIFVSTHGFSNDIIACLATSVGCNTYESAP